MDTVMSLVRIVVGFLFFSTTTTLVMAILVLLLPFRQLRIKTCNYYGKVVGRGMMWISGCPMTLTGTEHLDPDRPAIYVSNHTSIVDGFLAMFLSPVGTVGIVKKQILYYPFFGQLYFLSGHLRIDRSNREAAARSMKALGDFVLAHGLSMFVWPEGTRSRDGQLLPFKKGIYHLAKQTRLPIVPIVVEGAHEAWVKGSMKIAPVPIRITVLPPISTEGWTDEGMAEHIDSLREQFVETLPESQRSAA